MSSSLENSIKSKHGKPSEVCLILLLISSACSKSPPGPAITDADNFIGGVTVNGCMGVPELSVTSPFIILPITTLLTCAESITSAFKVN